MKRVIEFTNIYADAEVVNVQAVEIPDGLDDWARALTELLWPLTGTGRSGDAAYFAHSIDDREPTIDIGWC